jgi:hypothetical protein
VAQGRSVSSQTGEVDRESGRRDAEQVAGPFPRSSRARHVRALARPWKSAPWLNSRPSTIAGPLLARNPHLVLHQMPDPNQDELMVRQMAYFRVKRTRLGPGDHAGRPSRAAQGQPSASGLGEIRRIGTPWRYGLPPPGTRAWRSRQWGGSRETRRTR